LGSFSAAIVEFLGGKIMEELQLVNSGGGLVLPEET